MRIGAYQFAVSGNIYDNYNEIERALVNYRVKNERRKNFEGYLQTIKKIRGY